MPTCDGVEELLVPVHPLAAARPPAVPTASSSWSTSVVGGCRTGRVWGLTWGEAWGEKHYGILSFQKFHSLETFFKYPLILF